MMATIPIGIRPPAETIGSPAVSPSAAPPGAFAEALARAGASTVEPVTAATKIVDNFTRGQSGNLHETMLALDKAEVSFKFLVNVRNRLLEAYREVMRMGG